MNKKREIIIFLTLWLLFVMIGVAGAFYITRPNESVDFEINWDSVSPITRDYKPEYKITEDTVFIRKLEQSTKKLLNHGK